VLRNGQAPQVHTLFLRAGLYSPSTTHDAFPLNLSGLAHLTLRGEDRATTVLDAEFRNDVVVAIGSQDLVIEDLTLTHGWHGLAVIFSRDIVIRRTESRSVNRHGIVVVATTGAVLQENLVERSRAIAGIGLAGGTEAVLTQNVSRAHPLHGILVQAGSRADMRDNVFEDNGLSGIVIDLNSSATLTNNLTQGNALDGLTLSRNASATLTDNVIQDNGRQGINVSQQSSLTASNNIIVHNDEDGIQVSDAGATLTDNLVQDNGQPTSRFGINVTQLSTAVLLHNTVTHSGSDGIRIQNTSEATISGGSSTQNSGDGIRVGGSTVLPGRCTAAIGLDGVALLELSQNSGAGLFVVDDGFGSEARIDSRQIVFSGNAGGVTVGNVVDVAVGP